VAFIVPNEGEIALLSMIKDGIDAIDMELILIKDGITLTNSTAYATAVAEEADFGGYAPIEMDAADFDAVATDGSNKAFMRASAYQTFTCDGTGADNDIKYYALVDRTNSKLLAFEDLPSVQTMADNGDPISIKPRLTLVTEAGN